MKKTLVLAVLTSSQLLVGCWDVTTKTPSEQIDKKQQLIQSLDVQVTTDQPVTDDNKTTIQAIAKNNTNSSSDNEKNVADNSSTQAYNAQKEEKQYDISAWNTVVAEPLNINEIGGEPAQLAKVVSTDESSLDFSSHEAIKYRFMPNDAPYFDLVDSEQFLEVHWYYANQSDTTREKQSSSDHAKKVHRFARQLMGDGGGNIVATMLFGQVVKNQTVGSIEVVLAKCEFYSCMLVMRKNKDAIQLIDNDEKDDQKINNSNHVDNVDGQDIVTNNASDVTPQSK